MSDWIVYHRDHSGNNYGEFNPLNLRWGKSLIGPGYITYDIPLSNALATLGQTRPYRSDFSLQTRGGGPHIMSGIHTEVSIQDHYKNRVMSVAGKDYLHYLEKVIWPKDPNSNYRTTTAADPTNGTVFDYTGSVSYVIYRLIRESCNDSGIADSLQWQFLGTPSSGGTEVRYRIDPGDTRTIADHISEILSMGDPAVTRFLQLVAPWGEPSLNFPSSALPAYGTSTPVTYKFICRPGGNAEFLSFRHGGIRGTRVFGIAQGPSNRKGVINYAGGSLYRRLDIVEEFSGPSALANLTTLVASAASEALVPDIEVQVKFYDNPEIFNPFMDELVFPGARVQLEVDLEWTDIVDTFTVTALDCACEDNGATEYTATLNKPLATV